jgi:hypothetical protein
MASNVSKRAADVVVRQRRDETPVAGTGASATADGADAKNGSETPQSQNPWPAEFGWDFPFDFPRPTRS